MERILIIGCGDVGLRLARRYRAMGWPISGLVRSEGSRPALLEAGIDAIRHDLDGTVAAPPLPAADVWFYLAPPPRKGNRDTRLAAFLPTVTAMPRRLIYLSTTGVYGDAGGAWVDETAPLNPGTERAWRRADAERRLADWCRHANVEFVTLRVAGIFKPHALPLRRLRERVPIVRGVKNQYTNRIHIEDLIDVLMAAATRAPDGGVYNVADNDPLPMADYLDALADHFGLPRPPGVSREQADQVISAGMLSYLDESRRIDNRRMREELGVALRYPTLQAALQDLA